MGLLHPATVLDVWERARSASAAERSLLLLEAGFPQKTRDALDQLTAAERDSLLLSLRESLFGAHLRSLVPCPRCHTDVELAFRTSDVRPAPPPNPGERPFAVAGYVGRYRLPVAADWVALSETAAETLPQALARRCLLSLEHTGAAIAVPAAPTEVLLEVAEGIAEQDTDAHTELAVACPECQHRWAALFDIGAFLWREFDQHARHLLLQVHRLASAYGWTENEILNLSAARRDWYLSLTDHG